MASEGYFILTWDLGQAPETGYVLQQAETPGFQETTDRSIPPSGDITLTGYENGTYYFRAGSSETGWTNTVEVEVRHHSLTRALSFFSLGLVLFLILIGTILWGNRKTIWRRRNSRRNSDGV